ncbi:hypothetical protein Vadar_021525 [Vaccinium darrowii]|uniref:Uncharacterized protein n=1 Tax=Vaccinium darrowii TaxID=229202 RepID=A0ACB7XBD3_9ERIC|nr:hypothetical protein Vadar_021525 [Vaccinium darrowii]
MDDELADMGMWGYNTTSTFINILLDEVKKEGQTSSKIDRNFTAKQWHSIEVEMEKRLRRRGYTMKKLQGEFVRLKKGYRAFRELKDNETGLEWDPETETVTMSDIQWKLYIQAHPDAKGFQKKGLDHYDLLAELLGNSMATGAFGHGNKQGESTSDDEREMEALMFRMRNGKGLAIETSLGLIQRVKESQRVANGILNRVKPAILQQNSDCLLTSLRKDMSSSRTTFWQQDDESSSDEDEILLMEMLESDSEDERRPQRTAPFTGQEYITFLLNGHPAEAEKVASILCRISNQIAFYRWPPALRPLRRANFATSTKFQPDFQPDLHVETTLCIL